MTNQVANQMQAWQVMSPGDIRQRITICDIPRPLQQHLHNDQILIKILAASLNPSDYKTPEMGFITRAVLAYPYTPGMDLGGEVIGKGTNVTDVKIGDIVAARLSPFRAPGALCEYAIASPNDYALLSKVRDPAQAAGLGTAGLTAYQTIEPYVKAGDRIFINGGSGGVGTYGIQIAKLLGCHVTVSCSTSKVAICKQLGADLVIDYKTTNVVEALRQSGQKYAHAVDNVGTSPPYLHASSSAFLLPTAKFVLVSGIMTWDTFKQGIYAKFWPAVLGGGKNPVLTYLTTTKRKDLTQLATWLEEGKLRTVVDCEFVFEKADEAFQKLREGSATGKIIVNVGVCS